MLTSRDRVEFATRSCFLAIKYASEAMKETGGGKPESGGSIVLTASGKFRPIQRPVYFIVRLTEGNVWV